MHVCFVEDPSMVQNNACIFDQDTKMCNYSDILSELIWLAKIPISEKEEELGCLKNITQP